MARSLSQILRLNFSAQGPHHLLMRTLIFLALLCPFGARGAEIVFEIGSNKVLLEADADRPWHPASLTKLMTAYLTLEALKSGQLSEDQVLVASAQVAEQPITSLGLAEGAEIDVATALQALILRSANDVAVLLAEAIDGSEVDFARHMTQKARALGMASTLYVNASGLPNDAQITTARDQAILVRALIRDFPKAYGLFGTQEMVWAGDWLPNINGILDSLEGADGLKTGFTCKSGYNLAVSAKRGGHRIVAIILGARSPDQRTAKGHELIDHAFADIADPVLLAASPLLAAVAPFPRFWWIEPKVVLDESECGYGVGAGLPGWGLALGAYPSRGKALSVAEKTLSRLGEIMTVGKTATMINKAGTKFHALIVGLSASQARSACKALRNGGGYCLVLKPEIMNNPGATWR